MLRFRFIFALLCLVLVQALGYQHKALAGCSWTCSGWPWDWHVHFHLYTTAYAVNTVANGGPHSYENPSMRATYDGYFGCVRCEYDQIINTNQGTITLGRPGTEYTYVAALCMSTEPCQTDPYANTCNGTCGTTNTACGCDAGYEGENILPDSNVAGMTKHVCSAGFGSSPKGSMISVCTYATKAPSWTIDLAGFFMTGRVKTTMIEARKAASQGVLGNCEDATGTLLGISGCAPAVFSPMPPPFSHTPIKPTSQMKAFPICSQQDLNESPDKNLPKRPVALLSALLAGFADTTCVLPTAGDSLSTFSNPRIRITYDVLPQTPSPSQSGSFDEKGNELLYTQIWQSSSPNSSQTFTTRNVYIDNDMNTPESKYTGKIENIYSNCTTSPTSTSPPFIDLDAPIDVDGNLQATVVNFTDGSGNVRYFTLTFAPSNDRTSPTSTIKNGPGQICAQEVTDTTGSTLLGHPIACFNRPIMQKPTVALVTNALMNDNSNASMNVTLPDYSSGYNKTYTGTVSTCLGFSQASSNGGSTTPNPPPCPLPGENTDPFGFTALSTNNCYATAAEAPKLSGTSSQPTNLAYCYINPTTTNPSCPMQSSADFTPQYTQQTTCDQCALDQLCYLLPQSSTPPPPPTMSGVTKLCLSGYTENQVNVTPSWCDGDCNNILTNTTPETGTGQTFTNTTPGTGTRQTFYFPIQAISGRSMPSPATPGALAVTDAGTNQWGSYTPPAVPPTPPVLQMRTLNPIEAGLCVDVYPFTIKNCESFDPTEQGVCTGIKSYCSSIGSDPTSYANFSECIGYFTSCLANPLGSITTNLGSTPEITMCYQLLALIYPPLVPIQNGCPSGNPGCTLLPLQNCASMPNTSLSATCLDLWRICYWVTGNAPLNQKTINLCVNAFTTCKNNPNAGPQTVNDGAAGNSATITCDDINAIIAHSQG